MQISKIDIYKKMLFIDNQAFNKNKTQQSVNECVSLILSIASFNNIQLNKRQIYEIRNVIQKFFYKVQDKLLKYSFNHQRFEKNEESWLNCFLPVIIEERSLPGRPKKSWEDKGSRAKNIELHALVENNSLEKLLSAAALKASKEKKNDLKWVLNHLILEPQSAFLMKSSFQSLQKKERQTEKLSNDEALVLLITADLSKHSYQQIRCF